MKLPSLPTFFFSALGLSLWAQPMHAQTTQDPFDELEQEISKLESEGSEKDRQAFIVWRNVYLADYQAFRQQHFNRIDDIRDQLINTWGEADTSTASKMVVYSDDQQTKTVIDLDKNEVSVSILHDESQDVSAESIKTALSTAIKSESIPQTLNEEFDAKSTSQIVETASISQRASKILEDSVGFVQQELARIETHARGQAIEIGKIIDMVLAPATDNDASGKVASDIEIEAEMQKELAQITSEKNQRIDKLYATAKQFDKSKNKEALKNKKITTYTMGFKQRNYIKKAQQFTKYMNQYSQQWKLPQSLLFAIMHTESHFNPKAQSHIPAFGLMQIVPRSAGLDVNRFLYEKEDIMTKDYLFEPANNIQTGVAYMHILNSRYLAAITDAKSRYYCMIAAYNTGAGNVAKAFNSDKSRNIRKASEIINTMTPSEVYTHLLANLPHEETKLYIEKVVKRQAIYKSFD
jgi:membrane-bound lytic murein transglycosylase C